VTEPSSPRSGSSTPSTPITPGTAAPAASQAFWSESADGLLRDLDTTRAGLTAAEAATRLARFGPNRIDAEQRASGLKLLARQFTSPIILILIFATILSGILGDATDAVLILAIIALSGLLGFWQERGAAQAVDALLAVVQVTSRVRRDGTLAPIPLVDVVPGDVAELAAGDVIPGDCLVLESHGLQVDESALTGEAYPVEKLPGILPADTALASRSNACYLGTHVASGTGTVLVVQTGQRTEFGRLSAHLHQRPAPTGFEQGMTAFGYLLVRVMLILTTAIFVVNLVLARPLLDSALFSLALAVGLTPQLLPAIVTISLSTGARLMARRRVIVKRLDAIEDFGSMTILCTDKTGTMTVGTVELQATIGPDGSASDAVEKLAYLNAKLQTGFSNPIDDAIVSAAGPASATNAKRLDEVPYDFTRRRLSILVDDGGKHVLITKGAFADVLAVCTSVSGSASSTALADANRTQLNDQFAQLSGQGLRVLGVATRDMGSATTAKRATRRTCPSRDSSPFSTRPSWLRRARSRRWARPASRFA
jgi:Mg2+-importing ATPase